MNILLVVLGGFLGSIVRFSLSIHIKKRLIATLIANITGAILLGILFRLYENGQLSSTIWTFLGIGFCGSYTTFSTFGNETLQLLINQEFGLALTYICTSFIISITTVAFIILI